MRYIPYSQRFLTGIFLCFLFVQCSNNSESEQPEPIHILDEIPQHIQEVENLTVFPGDSEPMYSIELISEQTFGETGEPYLTRILGCVIDDKGKAVIWNADSNYKQILYVYNVDGTYHTQLGRQGKGPGEYGHMVGLQAKDGKVSILDFTSQRLNEYSTKDYSFLNSILFESWESGDGLKFGYTEPRNDGNYLVFFSDNNPKLGRLESKYQVMDAEGNALNIEPLVFPAGFSIKVGESMRPTMPLTFLGRTITSLSDEDTLYSVWTRDFLIRKYDANGIYQSAIYYPVEGLPFDLNASVKSNFFSPKAYDIENTFDVMDIEFPETLPVIDRLMVDDENRMWVAVPADIESENYEWWILAPSGELLATLLLPRDQPIYDIKDGYLYSKKTNEETDTEFVVKYRIELTEN